MCRLTGVISSISAAVLKQSYIFTFSFFNPAVCRLYNLIPRFYLFGPHWSHFPNVNILCSFCPLLKGTFLHFSQLEQICSSTSAGANSSCHPKLDRKTCGIFYQHFLSIKLWAKSTDSFAPPLFTKNLIRLRW